MSLAMNNNSFGRNNFHAITKRNTNGQQFKRPADKQEVLKLKNIFELLPSDSSSGSRSSLCSPSIGSLDDTVSSVCSDSGFSGSEGSVVGEKKRWQKVDDDLLHTDLKLFIQKYGIGFKSANDEMKKSVRSGIDYQKFFKQVAAASSEEKLEEITRKLEKLVVEPKTTDAVYVINQHFAHLRDVIAHYHADKAFVEREVFKLPVTATAELVLDETEYFFDSVSKILEHLWFKMDVNAVEKFIDGMTVYCEKQGMGIENFEVGLKELMLCFRSCAIDYITATSDQNLDNFTRAMRLLASGIHNVSTRLWILSSLIKHD